jgi:hypothetical protein
VHWLAFAFVFQEWSECDSDVLRIGKFLEHRAISCVIIRVIRKSLDESYREVEAGAVIDGGRQIPLDKRRVYEDIPELSA